MIDYTKTILEKVSFDKRLFEKELLKSVKFLVKEEIEELKKWCTVRYGSEYTKFLQTV